MPQAAIMDRSPHNPRYKRHRPEQTFLYQIVEQYYPELILLQCGTHSIKGDPITNMEFSPAAHAHAAASLCRIPDDYCQGRMLAMGGGGYNHDNIARGWIAVVVAMVKS